jgi:hypothetical protein
MRKHTGALAVAARGASVATACWMVACGLFQNGPSAFRASQKAAMKRDQFNVELDRKTKMGEFKESMALDCKNIYFYDHEVDERSPEGIESGATLSQGRPSSHQESETLFVDGKTYGRNTSSWENAPPSVDDASPQWHPISILRSPQRECSAMKQGEGLGYVSYTGILKEGHIEYLGREKINGHRCAEYKVAFDSQAVKGVKVCLGTSDDLPYRVVGEDYTATYNYEPIARLAAPN